MCDIFSNADWAGVLANAEMVFKKRTPLFYESLKNRRLKCQICDKEFTDFFEHFAEHMKKIVIETVVLNYYNTCLDFIEFVKEADSDANVL